MRKIREVLRLRLEAQLSFRQISICTKVSVGSIQKLLKSAQALGLSWPLPTELDDGRLAALFYPQTDTTISARHVVSDWPSVHQELKRKGVSKLLLWEEYTQRYPNSCYSYSQLQVLVSVAKALHAPAPQGGGKTLYRLLRAHGAHRVADYG